MYNKMHDFYTVTVNNETAMQTLTTTAITHLLLPYHHSVHFHHLHFH